MSDSAARGGPLAGIRVIDLSRLAPGPYASMLLADLGAEVIAVTGGRAGQVPADFARGKRFVHLNLKHPASRRALHRLAATADVLIEGFRPGVADRLGAGYPELSQVNPRLVYCSVTGYDPAGRTPRPPGTTSTTWPSPACSARSGRRAGSRCPRSTWSPTWPAAVCWPRSASARRSSSGTAPGTASGSTPR